MTHKSSYSTIIIETALVGPNSHSMIFVRLPESKQWRGTKIWHHYIREWWGLSLPLGVSKFSQRYEHIILQKTLLKIEEVKIAHGGTAIMSHRAPISNLDSFIHLSIHMYFMLPFRCCLSLSYVYIVIRIFTCIVCYHSNGKLLLITFVWIYYFCK